VWTAFAASFCHINQDFPPLCCRPGADGAAEVIASVTLRGITLATDPPSARAAAPRNGVGHAAGGSRPSSDAGSGGGAAPPLAHWIARLAGFFAIGGAEATAVPAAASPQQQTTTTWAVSLQVGVYLAS